MWKRVLSILLVIQLLIPNVFVFAEGDSDSSNYTRFMISYFRDSRTKLQVDKVSRDEIIVYGVFLSNFFIPYVTKLGDMISNEGDNSIAKQVSKRFFGTTEKSNEVVEINKKLYDAISKPLGFEKEDFLMYADKGGKKVLGGEELLNKISGKDKDSYVYGKNGVKYLNINDKATKAVFKVLFGFSPEMFLSEDKGLSKVKELYVDGLGNIWGSYGKADVNDYVIILPASLNPVVFSKSVDNTKFPVHNVFSMGVTLKITQNFLDGKNFLTPYYNIYKHIPTGSSGASKYNDNMVILYGVQSISPFIGQTDTIISKGNTIPSLSSKIKNFVDQDKTTELKDSDLNIILSVDSKKVLESIDDVIVKNKNFSLEERRKLLSYLMSTIVFDINELADDMYYFKVPTAQNYNASGDEEGSFDNLENIVEKQKLFLKEEKGSKYFYSNSFISAPFNKFLAGYYQASNKDNYLKGYASKLTNADIKIIKNLLEKGVFNTKDGSGVKKALENLHNSKNLIYGVVRPSNTIENLAVKSWFSGLVDIITKPIAFGLGGNDRHILTLSALVESSVFKKGKLADEFLNLPKESEPFKKTEGGGVLKGTLSKTEEERVSSLFYTTYLYRLFSMNHKFTQELSGISSGDMAFNSPIGGKFKNGIAVMNEVNAWAGMYWGYMVNMLGVTIKDGEATSSTYSNPHLPYMEIDVSGSSLDIGDAFGESGAVDSDDKVLEELQKDIVKKVHGLLSENGSTYRDNLIKSILDSWFLSVHRAITNSWVGGFASVGAKADGGYASVVGFINMPSFEDLPLMNKLLNDYMYSYVLLVVIIFVVVLLMVLTNLRTVKEGLVIFIIMLFITILPKTLVVTTVDTYNKFTDKIFSDRFIFWTITSHQQSYSNLKNASYSSDSTDLLITTNMDMAKNVHSNNVSVRVKWMSPKKDDVFKALFSKNSPYRTLESDLTLFKWLFNSFLNQEEYEYKDKLATYLYRPYNAIVNEARVAYDSLKDTSIDKKTVKERVFKYAIKKSGLGNNDYHLYGYSPKIKYVKGQDKVIAKTKPLGERDDYIYWVISNETMLKAVFNNNVNSPVSLDSEMSDPYFKSYLLTTESPYYYFYNVLSHRYKDDKTGASFKDALLTKNTFKVVNSGNGKIENKLKDFLDLEGLFTYVIPVLNQGNVYVRDWMSVNKHLLTDFDYDNGLSPDPTNKQLYSLYLAEKSAKEQFKDVWKLHSAWVDTMYNGLSVSDYIYVANKRKLVKDTLNPSTYLEQGREMIFSEADMRAKGYTKDDLSDVERRLQNVLENTYKDMMYLVNYYDFDDEVLLSASAMVATFNFNREFSSYSLLNNNNILYPQSFELKNFNYDAFMRLMLLNATGEPIMADKDLYVRVLTKTSPITGFVLILVDVVAVYILPAMKYLVLMLLFVLVFLVSLSFMLAKPDKLVHSFMKLVGYPFLVFFVSSIVFAYVVGMFVGDGLSGYVGAKIASVNITDPTVLMVALLMVTLVYMYVLYKVVVMMWSSIKQLGTGVLGSTTDMISGVFSNVVAHVKDRVDLKLNKEDLENLSVDLKNKEDGSLINDKENYNNYYKDKNSNFDTNKSNDLEARSIDVIDFNLGSDLDEDNKDKKEGGKGLDILDEIFSNSKNEKEKGDEKNK